MTVFKSSNISVEIRNGKVDIGDVGVKFYTQDINTTLLNIRVLKDEQFLNFNDEQYKPFINLFMGDGSVFLDQPVEISDAENGLLTYKLADKVKHAGWVKFKLILKKEDESLHAANFKLEILDSGLESEIGRVIDVDILMNAFERFALKYPEKIRGKAFTFDDFTEEQLALLKGPKGDVGPKGEPGADGKDGVIGKSAYEIAVANGFKGSEKEWVASLKGKDGINIVPDESITTLKLADKAVSNSKLSDFFSSVRQLKDGENLTSFSKEGIYFKPTTIRLTDIPSQLTDGGYKFSGFLVVKPFSQYHYIQELHELNNTGVIYTRVVKNNANSAWKSNSDDEKVKILSNEQVNDKLQYNLNVFEKRSNEVIPDKNILYANAIQDIRIEGVDPDTPVKIWTLCRAFSTWNYRIILGKYEDGAWSTLLDTGINFTVTESEKGATDIEYSAKGITLKARIDYNVIPKNDRIVDHAAITDEPYFIIRPEKVGVPLNGGGGGTAYNQSLNTTDNVKFASIKTDSLEVTGELPTGTLSKPPSDLIKGDMWLDTTDNKSHPIVRMMV